MAATDFLRSIPWETRNLGLESFAVADRFLEEPDPEALKLAIARETERFGSIFIQSRLPKGELGLGPLLEGIGFYFVETALVPNCVLKKNAVLGRFLEAREQFLPGRYPLESLSFASASGYDADTAAVVKAIAAQSFSDDRFHLDPNCSQELADGRYSYWVDDMVKDPALRFDLLRLSGEPIGFMARRGQDLLLAGFARKYVNAGLGDFLWLSVLEQMLKEGFLQVQTMISANNIPVLNLYARIGFKFKDATATYHYWSDRMAGAPERGVR